MKEKQISTNDIEDVLALIYAKNNTRAFLAVAEVCDEVLDKSGGLLGRVRDKAIDIKTSDKSL